MGPLSNLFLVLWAAVPAAGLVEPSVTDSAPATATAGSLFNQDSRSSRGTGTEAARIDSQITLTIPEGKAPEVYAFLRRVYAESDERLRQQFPGLPLTGADEVDVSLFTDRYFDTAELSLYGTGNTVRHRNRINTTNPEDRKSGRHLVQIKVTPPGRFDLRTELKFDVQPSKKYRDEDDAHPLIQLVERVQRSDLKAALRRIGIEPLRLRPVLTIEQQRSRVYLYWGRENFLSFSVDQFAARSLWAVGRSSSVDIGLVENVYTEADSAKRRAMWAIRDQIVADLRSQFPDLEVNSTEKYTIMMAQIEEKLPWIRFLLRHNLL